MLEVRRKLEDIREVWNYYIFKLKFFRNYYNFDAAAKSNYFGEILGHFSDSLHLIEKQDIPESFEERFSFQIALLQTIFVQQDLIEEMYRIFKMNFYQKDLYKDDDYRINREIRNELIGHPIRREKGNGKMLSSVSLSYNSRGKEIEYARYHISNNYRFEKINHSVDEIIERHVCFLKRHLDEIYKHTHKSLKKYQVKVDNLIKTLENKPFKSIVKGIENGYESFQDESYLYKTGQILDVYSKRDKHPRYQLVIDKYLFDAGYHLRHIKGDIKCILEGEKFDFEHYPETFSDFQYELGKLLTKRESEDFSFFESVLRSRIKDNEAATKELDFLVESKTDEIDYYSSYYYLRKLLS